MSAKKLKQKVWVWLTVQQIDAVLAAAQVIDANPEAELRKVRDALETK